MFRVIYQWKVKAENFSSFQTIWSATTDHIHCSVSGALGSFMVRSIDDPEKVLTIAKWRSKTDWQAFWKDSNPEAMKKMRMLAERISVEAFDEIDDRTQS